MAAASLLSATAASPPAVAALCRVEVKCLAPSVTCYQGKRTCGDAAEISSRLTLGNNRGPSYRFMVTCLPSSCYFLICAYSVCSQLSQVQHRHRLLSHKFITLLRLIDDLAVLNGIFEENPQTAIANEDIIARLEGNYNVEDIRARAKVAKLRLEAHQASGDSHPAAAGVSGDSLSASATSKGYYDVLSTRSEVGTNCS
eukprot:GHVT01049528.1.p1 GENE.GHVT01049528.1~~GHVT01049528.1.p1  ORF type:complete len:199 (-),score=11.75 GHVT01049528.1:301-897(-)